MSAKNGTQNRQNECQIKSLVEPKFWVWFGFEQDQEFCNEIMTDTFVGIDTGNSGMKGMYCFTGTEEVHHLLMDSFVHETTLSETTLSRLQADLERGSCIGFLAQNNNPG